MFDEGEPAGQDTEGDHDGTQDDGQEWRHGTGAATRLGLTGDSQYHIAVGGTEHLTDCHVVRNLSSTVPGARQFYRR